VTLSATTLFNSTATGGSVTNIMSVLTQTSLDAATALAQKRFALVQTQMQSQYTKKLTALQAQNKPTATERFLQVEISGLAQQKATFSALQTQYGNNSNILGDLSTQLAAVQNAVQAGDSAAFDSALGTANSDVTYLTVVNFNPALQPDGVQQLKANGLGIKSSSSYDLSTAAGKAAAIADITAAQTNLGQVSLMTTTNQTIAGSQANALGSQYSAVYDKLQSDQFTRSAQATTDMLKLKNDLNTRLHLVELQFTNTQASAKSLENQQNNLQSVLAKPAPGTVLSIFA
jgi:hypothetical protein